MTRNPAFWIVLFLVIVLLFGATKLPQLAGSVGKSLKIFKKEVSDLQEDDEATGKGDAAAPGNSTHATIDYGQSTVPPAQGSPATSAEPRTEPPK